MIKMMYDYTDALQKRLNRMDDHSDAESKPDNALLHASTELVKHTQPLGGIANFTDYRMAVMTMCVVDSAAEQSGSNYSLVQMLRKAAMTVVGEVVVVEEAWNSVVVAVGPDTTQSTRSPVPQLLAIAAHVANEVYAASSDHAESKTHSLLGFRYSYPLMNKG